MNNERKILGFFIVNLKVILRGGLIGWNKKTQRILREIRERKNMKSVKFQAPKGMKDILPEEQKYWQYILDTSKLLVEFYNYKRIDTPILEDTQLFKKGTGATSDIVEKELFSLTTKGNDKLSLRPEFTPNIIRAYFEHGMASWPQPVKLYYFGPVFRYDRPQAGRLRQFYQIGFEAIGLSDSVLDAQIIQISWKIYTKLGISKDLNIQINSIGCPECRPDYNKLLTDYYKGKTRQLCANCKVRLRKNPLRLLDCKEGACIRLMVQAPQSVDHLCAECHEHFKSVLEYLDELNLPYELNYKLVRGLDYYTKTVFEFWPKEDCLAQSALGGGGRYDGLAKIIGNKEVPGVGVSLGVERIIMEIQKQQINLEHKEISKVFLAQLGALSKRKALKLFEILQEANIQTAESFTRDSLKAQLRIADKIGAKITLILGQKEALEDSIIIRNMETGAQEVVPINKLVQELRKRLK